MIYHVKNIKQERLDLAKEIRRIQKYAPENSNAWNELKKLAEELEEKADE